MTRQRQRVALIIGVVLVVILAVALTAQRSAGAERGCDQHAGRGECLAPSPTPVRVEPSFTG